MIILIKINEIEEGMIIWNNKCEILGITGVTLPKEYYEQYAIKIEGNDFDYMILDLKEEIKNTNN